MRSWRKSTSQNAQREPSKPTRIGEIAKQMFPNVGADSEGGDQADAFTYGNVWLRIWKNHRRNGQPYYRVSLNRIDARNGEKIVRKNFTLEDFDDLLRAVCRCKIWFDESRK